MVTSKGDVSNDGISGDDVSSDDVRDTADIVSDIARGGAGCRSAC